MTKYVFKGSAVALITPFKDGGVDFDALGNLIDFQLKNKTDAIVVLGTTGEPSTMTEEEKREVVKFSKARINGRAKLIVGSGGNNTQKVVEDSLQAKKYGADALLIVTPYYNKCTQKGLVAHYKLIAESVKLPIICYNVPGRTGVNILPETALELASIKYICGIKEASGNISQIVTLFKLLRGKMAIYSGEDSLNYIMMTMGSYGVISVVANVLPGKVKSMVDSCLNGDYSKALNVQEKLADINRDLFVEVNPIPVKYACSLLNLCGNEIRLPLTELEDKNKPIVASSLENALGRKLG